MSSPDPLLEVLETALSLEGEQRESYLLTRCASDSELLVRVRELLQEDSSSVEWNLERPRELLSPLLSSNHFPLLGQRIGPWQLKRVLGEGGMGTVYLGERSDDTFDQQVAIKVIRQDVQQGQMLERFEQERHIHAALDHPAIATLLDAGRTEEGSPYFVMEYVPGERIDAYCEHLDLDAKARIQLFLQVCRVVHDTHELGILHRDLKPSNLMVQPNGKVKLLDFGVALVLGGGEDTEHGALPFVTPAYASPESLLRQPITRASDQYSLGVILQELLTDRRPTLTRGHGQPGTDSTMPAFEGGATPLGRLRRGVLAAYPENSRFLRDLRAILARALDQNPRNRYGTVLAFDQDLERLLADEAVKARPVRGFEALRRRLILYRSPILLVSLVSVIMIGSLVYTQNQGRQYRHALQQSKAARSNAEDHAQVMERFAREILTGLELRLRRVPNAYALRDALLSIGTKFFEDDPDPSVIPEGLLVTVLDAYRNLALLRLYPMEGGGTRLRDAVDSFAKAMALVPKLEQTNPFRGRAYRALLLLDWGLAETENLQLAAGYAKLTEAQRLFREEPVTSGSAGHILRNWLMLAVNRKEARDREGALQALLQFGQAEKHWLQTGTADPFLEGTCFVLNLNAANLWLDLDNRERAQELYATIQEQNWTHPSGSPNQDVTSALGYIQRLKLDWRLGDKDDVPDILARLDGVLAGLLREGVEETHYPDGVARLYSLRAEILESEKDYEGARVALEECFRYWRFCIRRDPDNAAAKQDMSEALLRGIRIAQWLGSGPSKVQALREEARAYLEALKRSDVDHPMVLERIQELDQAR